MTAVTTPLSPRPQYLRPLNVLRDLTAVADLVETCFASTLDDDGLRFIQQMRRSGKDSAFIRWAAQVADTVSMPLSGFVWEEAGKIIGNTSLIPFRWKRFKYYLISNVAVHPNHRRRGIGRSLTIAAMELARQKHAHEIWLHVRDDNPGAIHLYENLGFQVQARRSSWRTSLERKPGFTSPPHPITRLRRRDWTLQEGYLRRYYPESLDWYQPLPLDTIQPDLFHLIGSLLLADDYQNWAVRTGKELAASLTWRVSSSGHPDRLWLAIPSSGADNYLIALLLHARLKLAYRQSTLELELPQGEYKTALEKVGFNLHRTLLWMKWNETPDEEKRT